MSTDKELIKQFRALGDPTRYKLLQLINDGQNFCVSELATEVDVTAAGVSQQLKLLEQAGLIKPHRTGQKKCYKLNHTDQTKRLLKIIDQDQSKT